MELPEDDVEMSNNVAVCIVYKNVVVILIVHCWSLYKIIKDARHVDYNIKMVNLISVIHGSCHVSGRLCLIPGQSVWVVVDRQTMEQIRILSAS